MENTAVCSTSQVPIDHRDIKGNLTSKSIHVVYNPNICGTVTECLENRMLSKKPLNNFHKTINKKRTLQTF